MPITDYDNQSETNDSGKKQISLLRFVLSRCEFWLFINLFILLGFTIVILSYIIDEEVLALLVDYIPFFGN